MERRVPILVAQRLYALPVSQHDAPDRVDEQCISLPGAVEPGAIQADLGAEGPQAHLCRDVFVDLLRLLEILRVRVLDWNAIHETLCIRACNFDV